jgi:hypothetical protein
VKRGQDQSKPLRRSLVNRIRNVEKIGELNQCVDIGERPSRVGTTEGTKERGDWAHMRGTIGGQVCAQGHQAVWKGLLERMSKVSKVREQWGLERREERVYGSQDLILCTEAKRECGPRTDSSGHVLRTLEVGVYSPPHVRHPPNMHCK